MCTESPARIAATAAFTSARLHRCVTKPRYLEDVEAGGIYSFWNSLRTLSGISRVLARVHSGALSLGERCSQSEPSARITPYAHSPKRLLDAGRVGKEIPPLTGDTNVSVP